MAQGTCDLELNQLGHWDQFVSGGGFSDVWAADDVAYVGGFGHNHVYFIDISDPADPVRILIWSVAAPNEFCSAQDVKVHDGLLFIALDSDGFDGVEIVDVRDPFNPVHLTWIDTPGYADVHNVYYESGYLYLADSRTPNVGIVDLTTFDPDSPPARITEYAWLMENIGFSFVHDITVVDGRLYVCAWDDGLFIYDVTNIANEPPVFLGASAPSPATHSVWPTANGRWAVVGEERNLGPMRLYEIAPDGDALEIVLRDSVVIPGVFSIHNPVVIGKRIYASWYGAGVRIYDIDEQDAALVEMASADTNVGGPTGFNSTWGIFPLVGADRILASDIENGLFILDASNDACDDGLFCNGVEACAAGECVADSAPCPGQLCREFDDRCVECLGEGDCDDGAFCDGSETCDASGSCQPGVAPCSFDQTCLEDSNQCVDCLDDAGCDDSEFCTRDQCLDGACDNEPILYGDGNLDGIVDLDDILCVLDGFAGNFKRCAFSTLDIAECAGDGHIDLGDILAVLDAFSGIATCCREP